LNQFVWDSDKDPTISDIDNKEDFAGTTSCVTGGQFTDSFRYLYPDKEGAFTNWCTLTSARETNYGRRLDYIFTNTELAKSDLQDCKIMADIEGSDHCPVKAEYFMECIPADRPPALCTKFMPEFCGKQVKLSSFFKKMDSNDIKSECKQNYSSPADAGDGINGKCSLKRPSSIEKIQTQAKKKKGNSCDSKQGSLKGFFLKSSSRKEVIEGDIPESSSDAKSESHTTKREEKVVNSVTVKSNSASAWKSLLKGPPPPPLCRGHQEPCVLRTVKKPGPNKGKQFFVCARGEGLSSNPEARCDFFKWVDYKNN
jgi:AP endonuclease-2